MCVWERKWECHCHWVCSHCVSRWRGGLPACVRAFFCLRVCLCGTAEGDGLCSAVREVRILITRRSMVLRRRSEMDGVWVQWCHSDKWTDHVGLDCTSSLISISSSRRNPPIPQSAGYTRKTTHWLTQARSAHPSMSQPKEQPSNKMHWSVRIPTNSLN